MSKSLELASIFVISLLVTIAGCRDRPEPAATTLPFESPVQTPTASQIVVSPLVAPAPRHATPSPVTLSDKSKGAITGRLIHTRTGQPTGNLTIYLGEIIETQQSREDSPSYQIVFTQKSSPSTMVDFYGNFALVDLSPATYALVLWTPHNSWVITDSDKSRELRVTVEAGKVNDLGDILVDIP